MSLILSEPALEAPAASEVGPRLLFNPDPGLLYFTGGLALYDWRRPDYWDARDQAGGPIDAPEVLPCGSAYTARYGNMVFGFSGVLR